MHILTREGEMARKDLVKRLGCSDNEFKSFLDRLTLEDCRLYESFDGKRIGINQDLVGHPNYPEPKYRGVVRRGTFTGG